MALAQMVVPAMAAAVVISAAAGVAAVWPAAAVVMVVEMAIKSLCPLTLSVAAAVATVVAVPVV